MSRNQTHSGSDWPGLLQRLDQELAQLDAGEKGWLRERLDAIAVLQQALDALFQRAGGPRVCAACDGACCGCGRHHVTLANLLVYLLADQVPPAPDFDRTCPYLGEAGCRLPVPCRPYNCITFFCEQLEDGMTPEDRAQLRQLDRQLRREYQSIAERHPLASLQGLWIALDRAGRNLVPSVKQ